MKHSGQIEHHGESDVTMGFLSKVLNVIDTNKCLFVLLGQLVERRLTKVVGGPNLVIPALANLEGNVGHITPANRVWFVVRLLLVVDTAATGSAVGALQLVSIPITSEILGFIDKNVFALLLITQLVELLRAKVIASIGLVVPSTSSRLQRLVCHVTARSKARASAMKVSGAVMGVGAVMARSMMGVKTMMTGAVMGVWAVVEMLSMASNKREIGGRALNGLDINLQTNQLLVSLLVQQVLELIVFSQNNLVIVLIHPAKKPSQGVLQLEELLGTSANSVQSQPTLFESESSYFIITPRGLETNFKSAGQHFF
jgi:hypothetical protein